MYVEKAMEIIVKLGETSTELPAVHIVLHNSKECAGYFSSRLSGDRLRLSDPYTGSARNIPVSDIKEIKALSVKALVGLLWEQYGVVEKILAVEAERSYPFLV